MCTPKGGKEQFQFAYFNSLTSTKRISFIIDINQYKTSVCVAHLMDSSLFLNVFIKDSNNASQRLALTIEHSASYVTFVRFLCLICSYVTYA
ncbi:hypothetical protein T4D_5754 [Trichinella pseudospiralis]|uniref:Uncharacterized protein n=1 Tax=Trichinella pseudospiralis TaxID=6337 RepID=A0A0V1FN32_TRIPS|nr:hypothetical protein T4D_5754 [Trichinella pseudospiralis]